MKLLFENWRKYLNEIQKGLWRHLTTDSAVKDWPEYVIKEVIYNAMKGEGGSNLEDIKEWWSEDFGYENLEEVRWKLKDIELNISSFDEFTQERLKQRLSGSEWAEKAGIPKDKERLATQLKFAQASGKPSKEPIVIVQTVEGKYHLLEGWHRTLTYLENWGEYVQPTWIAESKKL